MLLRHYQSEGRWWVGGERVEGPLLLSYTVSLRLSHQISIIIKSGWSGRKKKKHRNQFKIRKVSCLPDTIIFENLNYNSLDLSEQWPHPHHNGSSDRAHKTETQIGDISAPLHGHTYASRLSTTTESQNSHSLERHDSPLNDRLSLYQWSSGGTDGKYFPVNRKQMIENTK